MVAPRSKRGTRGGLLGFAVPFSHSLPAIAVVAVIAFLPVVAYGFVYDDHWTVVGNRALDGRLAPLLRSLVLGRAAVEGIPDATRPTMVLSLWVDRQLFGDDPAGYHLHSLVLHTGCALLAALAVFAITRRTAAALVGGTLFAAAPLHAEVVASVNYREDLLAAGPMLAVLAWLFWPRRRPETVGQALLVAAVFFSGLLAKESAVVIAPLVVVLWAVRGASLGWVKSCRATLCALTVVLACWGCWRAWLAATGRDDIPLVLVPRGPVDRILRTARYAVRGAWDGLVPFAHSPEYAPEPSASPLFVPLFALLVAAIVFFARRRALRPVASALAIALIAPLATSPLVGPINETADRYGYLAVLGGAVLWGEIATRLRPRLPRVARLGLFGAASLLLVIACRSAASPFRDDLSLWSAATRSAPASPRSFTGLSQALRARGDLDGADRAIERAIALDPRFLRARVTRIYNALARGDVERARIEIGAVERLGGGRQRGMRQAVRCAALPPEEAPGCAKTPAPEKK